MVAALPLQEISAADIRAWLEEVPDPEIPVISVVDLGVVRDVEVTDDTVRITITPTYSGCPAMAIISLDIQTEMARRGVTSLELKTRLSPPWTTDWMSEKGKAQLEDFGIAPPCEAGGPEHCPHCKSTAVERVSQFGSTACKAQWRCQTCLEPFDYFKCL